MAQLLTTDEIDIRPFMRAAKPQAVARALSSPVGIAAPRARRSLSEITAIPTLVPDRSRTGYAIAGGAALVLMALLLWPSSEGARPKRAATKPIESTLAAKPVAGFEKIAAVTAPKLEVSDEETPNSPGLIVTRNDSPLEAKPIAPVSELATGEPGTLELDSDPSGLLVYEGDKRLGRTPFKTRLASGVHTLKFVDKKRMLEKERKYTVRAGGEHTATANFGIGTLKIEAPEGAKIFIDKKLMGTAPAEAFELVEGRHHLRIKGEEGEIEESLNVQAARTITLRTNLD